MSHSTQFHWDQIYKTKQAHEVSWTQDVPKISLTLIHQLNPPKNTSIIDVGGGDSKLADHLLEEGFTDITVLDISEAAIQRAKNRLGADADKINWIVSDVLDFHSEKKYGLWHDRAAFHFQTESDEIEKYLDTVKDSVVGSVIIGTFSVDGPKKCSGLEIKQYDEGGLKEKFESNGFSNTGCEREDHITPSGTVQNFVFCSFKRS